MEGIISEIAVGLALCAVFAMGVWCVWTIFKAMHDYLTNNHGNPPNEPEAPYKLEPEKPTYDVAIPDNPAHEAIKWTFANAPKPKRKYTKRSKFWENGGMEKRAKAAGTTRKSKRKQRVKNANTLRKVKRSAKKASKPK